MSTNTYEIGNYTITTSLGERNIYIKLIDQVNFIIYDGNVNSKELNLQFELNDIYKLIDQAFAEEEGYRVKINISNGFMKLIFNLLVGGFLNVNFEAVLKEKLMANDGQLTLNMNKMEQKFENIMKKIKQLEDKTENQQQENMKLMTALSNAVINITSDNLTQFRERHFIKINSKEATILNDEHGHINLSKLSVLYQLEKLTIHTFRHSDLSVLSINSLKELEIACNGGGELTSLNGIQNLPNLEKLTIIHDPTLRDVVNILSTKKHKIKTLIFVSCKSINVVELQTYCQVNNIQLNLS